METLKSTPATKIVEIYKDYISKGQFFFSLESVWFESDIIYNEALFRLRENGLKFSNELFFRNLEANGGFDADAFKKIVSSVLHCALNKKESIGFNISPFDLMNVRHREILVQELSHFELNGGDCSFIFIEVTERALLRFTPIVLNFLESLRAMGVTVVLDDYGAKEGCHTINHIESGQFGIVKLDGKDVVQEKLLPLFSKGYSSHYWKSKMDGNIMDCFTCCRDKNLSIVLERALSSDGDVERTYRMISELSVYFDINILVQAHNYTPKKLH